MDILFKMIANILKEACFKKQTTDYLQGGSFGLYAVVKGNWKRAEDRRPESEIFPAGWRMSPFSGLF